MLKGPLRVLRCEGFSINEATWCLELLRHNLFNHGVVVGFHLFFVGGNLFELGVVDVPPRCLNFFMLQGEAFVGDFTRLLGQVDGLRAPVRVVITTFLVLEENFVTLVLGVDLLLFLACFIIT